MLSVPTSLLQRWSDYHVAIPCVEALLTASLDDRPAVSPARLDFEALNAEGWRSNTARAQCIACCDDLVRWCVEHRRYVHNVAVRQTVGSYLDHDLVCTPLDPDASSVTGEKPHPLAAGIARLFTRTIVPHARAIGVDRVHRRRLNGELSCWSMAVRELRDGDLLLIDAPLTTQKGESGDTDFFLCDYPSLLRQPKDVRVHLRVSVDAAKELAALSGVRAGWHPFCRVLAIVEQEPGGVVLRALQFQFRSPIPDEHRYRRHPPWPESLLEDAQGQERELMEADWLKKALPAETSTGLSPEMAAIDLRKHLKLYDSGSPYAITRGAGSPYEGVEAFWCCLAVMLPAWTDDFPLAAGQVARLLDSFDATFTSEWRRVASQLHQAVELRYTPALMDEARSILAGLGSSRGAGETS